jgi:mRNA-degrading endonuclease RelE of RelBE toxin-antitoxin system
LANRVIKLTGSEYRRMRVGDYRVIFGIEHNQTTVMVVLRVRHRREAYG